jgi:hypothetical protein
MLVGWAFLPINWCCETHSLRMCDVVTGSQQGPWKVARIGIGLRLLWSLSLSLSHDCRIGALAQLISIILQEKTRRVSL